MYKSEKNAQSRDNIVRGTIKAGPGYHELYERAKQVLTDFLAVNKKRNTVERLYILEEIYSLSMPVDIETLHRMVCEEFGHVSQTTVYNNLDLFMEAGLVRRLDLVSGGMQFYEKKLGQVPRGFIVCRECGKLKAVTLSGLIPEVTENLPKRFLLEDLSLVATGLCVGCRKKMAEHHRKEK